MWRFLKDLEIEIPLDPAIPLLGIYPKDYKSLYYKATCMHMLIVALLTLAKTWNQPKCPWTGQGKCGTYTPWNSIQPLFHEKRMKKGKKDEFMFFAGTWMKLETSILSKLTQEQKTKHRMCSLISGY